jgi:transcriptional regulator with XRE-family HTH domain
MPKQSPHLLPAYTQYARDLAQSIGSRIRQRRTALGLDQAALRAKLERKHVFVSRTTLSRMENGACLPNAAEIIALTRVLRVSYEVCD